MCGQIHVCGALFSSKVKINYVTEQNVIKKVFKRLTKKKEEKNPLKCELNIKCLRYEFAKKIFTNQVDFFLL